LLQAGTRGQITRPLSRRERPGQDWTDEPVRLVPLATKCGDQRRRPSAVQDEAPIEGRLHLAARLRELLRDEVRRITGE